MKKGLGKGLGALLDFDSSVPEGTSPTEDNVGSEQKAEQASSLRTGTMSIDIRKIEPNQQQPRQYFDEDALQELAESIKSFGVIQPLIVKDCGDHYAIIAGERRFRAARIAKLTELPVIIKDYSEMETLQIALIENIQRQDLTPIEEATCYRRLIDDFFFAPEDIAGKVGKSKHAIAGSLKLLELSENTQQLIAEGKLTASHARVLLLLKDEEAQYACALKAVEEGLSVRGTEALVTVALKALSAAEATEPAEADPFGTVQSAYRRAEEELKTLLGARVNILNGKKKGKIEIEYYSPDELDRLLCLFKTLHG